MEEFEIKLAMLPAHMENGMRNYIRKGQLPGGFLTAILSGDSWFKVLERADAINQIALIDYAKYLYNYAPSQCWGSVEKVDAWVALGGLEGLNKSTEN